MPTAEQQALPPHVQLYDAINGLQSELVPPAADINGALEPFPAPEWRTDNRFQPAVFLRALPAPKRFRLLLSMPHLTCGVAGGDRYAPTLENYRRAVGELEQGLQPGRDGGEQIFVHLTTFAVINSGSPLHFRTCASADPVTRRPHHHGAHGERRNVQPTAILPAPVPRQRAASACAHGRNAHALLEAPRARQTAREGAYARPCPPSLPLPPWQPLNSYQDLHAQMHTHVWSASTSTSNEHATHRELSKELKRNLGVYIADLSAISHLVQAQLQVLDDMAAFVRNHAWDERDKGFNQDIFRMPLPLQREEHNRIVLDALKMVTDELEEFRARVGGLLTDARGLLRDTTDATNCVRPLGPPPPPPLFLLPGLTHGSTTSHSATRRQTSTKHARR